MPRETFQCPCPCGEPLLTHSSTGGPPTLARSFSSVSCGVTASLPWVLVCAEFCLCPSRLESLVSPVLCKSCNQILLALNTRFPGDSSPFVGSLGWEAWCWIQSFYNSMRTSLVLLLSSLCVTHLSDMRFYFIIIVPLWPSAVASSLSLDIGCLFLVGSSVLLLITVQQLVTVLVLSQEEMSICPSTPPSWTRSP